MHEAADINKTTREGKSIRKFQHFHTLKIEVWLKSMQDSQKLQYCPISKFKICPVAELNSRENRHGLQHYQLHNNDDQNCFSHTISIFIYRTSHTNKPPTAHRILLCKENVHTSDTNFPYHQKYNIRIISNKYAYSLHTLDTLILANKNFHR